MQNEKKPLKTALSILGNVILWVFLIFSMLLTIMVFSAQSSPDGIPSIFGKSLLTVATDSMKPTFSAGDLIIMDKLEQNQVAGLQVGDVITYRSPIDMNGDGMTGDINTHRILEIDPEKEEFITKGDNNPLADNQGDYSHTVSYHAVVGQYNGVKVAGLGKVLAFLRTSMGFFLCVVLPLILFFLYELYNFISVIVTEKMKKKTEEAVAAAAPVIDEEEIKRRAIEEYLAKQAVEEAIQAQKAKAAQEAAAEPAGETAAAEGTEIPAAPETAENPQGESPAAEPEAAAEEPEVREQ